MKHSTADKTDIYAVGLLAAWQQFVHTPDRPYARRAFRYALRMPLRHARAGNWRAVKNWFNGYLAEPQEFPPGVARCGAGWTRGRAYRDLQRLIAAAEPAAPEADAT